MTQLPLLTDDDDHPHRHNLYDAPTTRAEYAADLNETGQRLAAQIRDGIARKAAYDAAQEAQALYTAQLDATIKRPGRVRRWLRTVTTWFLHVSDDPTEPFSAEEVLARIGDGRET